MNTTRLIQWTLVVGVAGMLCLLLPPLHKADLAPGEVVTQWTQLYGQDTTRAALLTTERFRKGEEPQAWGARLQAALQEIGYHHLTGELVEEQVTEEVATITLKARIVAIDGVSLQREVYTLKRVRGWWLIDSLEVTDEVVPRGKLPYTF